MTVVGCVVMGILQAYPLIPLIAAAGSAALTLVNGGTVGQAALAGAIAAGASVIGMVVGGAVGGALASASAPSIVASVGGAAAAGAASGAFVAACYGTNVLRGMALGAATAAAFAMVAYAGVEVYNSSGSPALAEAEDNLVAGPGGRPSAADILQAANAVAEDATPAQRAMAETIYGEAGGSSYEDKLGVGWTMRNRFDAGRGLTYMEISNNWYAPQSSLRSLNVSELNAWAQSFRAAAEVLSSSSSQNPIPGTTHFYDPSITAPSWATRPGATRIDYGSGSLYFYRGVPW
jgi:hypothetical protein